MLFHCLLLATLSALHPLSIAFFVTRSSFTLFFGKENIVSSAMYRDERTPHMHVVVVPLTEDGRLSARSVVGKKEQMKDIIDGIRQRDGKIRIRQRD